jgi:protease IV
MRLTILLFLIPLVAGCGTPSFLVTPVQGNQRLREVQVQAGSGWRPDKIAIIEIEGMLLNARTGGFMQPTENPLSRFVEQLERAESDPSVKAVVLRINSPGGTVTTSDIMYRRLMDFRQRTGKPVIASAQDVVASGAYYVACAADVIIVQPTCVIGSIGVMFHTFNLEGTLAKLGARSETIKSAPLKDMGSPFAPLGLTERQIMQAMVDEYYQRFRGVVAASRPIPGEEALERATDGRIFTGEQAVELGLADAAGNLQDAIALARKSANSPRAATIMYKRPYGYSGSIYAQQPAPQPQAATIHLPLPPTRSLLPSGFYYLWEP